MAHTRIRAGASTYLFLIFVATFAAACGGDTGTSDAICEGCLANSSEADLACAGCEHPDLAAAHDGAPAGTDGPTATPPNGGVDFTPGTVPANAPPWLAQITPGTWKAISLNTIHDVDPQDDPAANPNYPNVAPWAGSDGQHGIIDAWCGGAYAYGFGSYGSMLVFGGGHGDYYGNEVYAFDLDSLKWTRLSNPYPTPMLATIDAYPEGRYPDGSPVPSHSADKLGYHPKTNSFVTLEGEVNNFGGYDVSIAYLFSLDQKKWRHSPRSAKDMYTIGWSVYDSKRDVFWTEGGSGSDPFSKFDPNPVNGDGTFGSWTNYVQQASALEVMGAYDPDDDAVVVTLFRSGSEIRGIDPANPTTAAVTLTQSGGAPSVKAGHGWDWSAARHAFVYWSGGAVYELKASGGDWRTTTWTWTNITNPVNAVTPDYTANGVFGRFRIAKFGSAEVAITVNSVNGAVYAFRIP